ncbi:MAG: glycosyltransferase family 4 protein [Candidatus Nitrosotenuis sp.]
MKRLLIGGSPSKLFHLNEFADTLGKNGVECKVVLDSDIYDGFPSRKIRNWFQTKSKFNELIKQFRPDAIFIDRHRHFGVAAAKTGLPLFVHIRGDHWKEIEMARQTLYKSFPKRYVLSKWEEMAEQCFLKSTLMLPICRYLEDIIRQRYPTKDVATLYQGINPSNWYHVEGMSLKHPCVGLLQGAVIFEKAREMLTLENVLRSFPQVTFYWVGDGPYRDYVLTALKKHDNFVWLGAMSYPNKVREYLSEIDVYALVSGIDMSPLTLLEAQLMEKPAVATKVGGIPELIQDGQTGYLIEKGDPKNLADKLEILLGDRKKATEMGKQGRKFVTENFSWDVITKKFLRTVKKYGF